MRIKSDAGFRGSDVSGLLSKYRTGILAATLCCFLMSMAVVSVLPKKYKSHFVCTVDAKYFQNPLTREFIPEINERADLKAEAGSLVRQAITSDFLDHLGTTYGIYQAKNAAIKIPPNVQVLLDAFNAWVQQQGLRKPKAEVPFDVDAAREALRKRIEISEIDDSTFQVNFVYVDPNVTYQVTKDLNQQVLLALMDNRSHHLMSLRDAIRKRLEFLAANVTASTESVQSPRSELAREELANVRDQIRTLAAQYTEEHPVMQDLRSREQTLNQMVAASAGQPSRRSAREASPVLGGEPQADIRDMYNDLLRKMNYLNIALDSEKGRQDHYIAILESPIYPDSPVGPKRILFALWGCALGLFGSLFVAAIRDYFDRSTLHADALAHHLAIPLLGKCPFVSWKDLKLADRN